MPSITTAVRNAMVDAAVDRIDLGSSDANGDLVIYDGTPPANVATALSGNTVLARVELPNPAFDAGGTAGAGIATLNGVPLSDLAIDATGTASFARIFDRDNVAVMQLTLTATGGGGEIEVNSVSFVASAVFSITAGTITQPAA